MNKLGALLVIGGSIVSPCLPLDALVVATPPQPGIEATEATDRYIVQFDAGTDPVLEAARLGSLGVEVAEVYQTVFPGVAVSATVAQIGQVGADPSVARVEPDQVMSLNVVQSNAPWGLDRIDQRSLPLSTTYSYDGAGAGVTAYIVDSGIRAAHLDFGGRVRSGLSTVPGNPTTEDCHGHGTHVAGIVGGQTYGVAKSVSLVAVRVLDCLGFTTSTELLQALDWVITDHPAGAPAVANLSIGGPPSATVDAAVQAVIDDGITVTVAAGNGIGNPAVAQPACSTSPARAQRCAHRRRIEPDRCTRQLFQLRRMRRAFRSRREHRLRQGSSSPRLRTRRP